MKKAILFAAVAMLSAPMATLAQPEAGEKSFTISGTGASDENFDGNSFGVSAEIGVYHDEHLLYGLRQSVNGTAGEDVSDAYNGSTRFFVDYHFGENKWRPYLGANIGGIYGKNVKETGTAGVDFGVKYFVLDKTFISVGGEYQFLFESGDDIDNTYDDGAFFYTLGVGFNF